MHTTHVFVLSFVFFGKRVRPTRERDGSMHNVRPRGFRQTQLRLAFTSQTRTPTFTLFFSPPLRLRVWTQYIHTYKRMKIEWIPGPTTKIQLTRGPQLGLAMGTDRGRRVLSPNPDPIPNRNLFLSSIPTPNGERESKVFTN